MSQKRHDAVCLLGALLFIASLESCASLSLESPSLPNLSSASPGSAMLTEHQPDPAEPVPSLIEHVAARESPRKPAPPEPARATVQEPSQEATTTEEEFYDPFARPEERAQEIEEYDPWEPFNVVMFNFNRKVDKYVLKPVAQVYDKVVPDEFERGLSNAIHNVRFVPRFINNLLQGKFKGAALEVGRFLINSTFGIAGFIDFAKEVFNMETPDEDTGQTLGVYGIKPGPYLVLPLLPPLTLRDAIGLVGDYALEPMNYFVFAVNRVGQPALITHQNTATFGLMGERAGEIINERSINLETFQGVEESTLDLYGAVRNAYLQRRAKQIRE